MNSQQIKEILLSEIHEVSINYEKYCNNPKRDFSRKRKLPFELMLKNIIGMGSKSITNELIDIFQASGEMPSASAFVQQRTKIKPEALKAVFDGFMSRILASVDKMRILAVDGSDTQIETNPKDKMSHIPTSIDKKSFNLLHLNALYDLEEHVYTDAIIQAAKSQNEHGALNEMVDRSEIPKALVIADRGYESYNVMAHIYDQNQFFLIRIKDFNIGGIAQMFPKPNQDEFDQTFTRTFTRHSHKKYREKYGDYIWIRHKYDIDFFTPEHDLYKMTFRIIRIKISNDTYECLVTNLPADEFKTDEIKKLYRMRWGIETSFKELKYSTALLYFHSKKEELLHQEIYAKLIMYNFSQAVISKIKLVKKHLKYEYKINHALSEQLCSLFLKRATSIDIESMLQKALLPVRPNRSYKRTKKKNRFINLEYRP